MNFRELFNKLPRFLRRKDPPEGLHVVETPDPKVLGLRAMQLWATDRNSAEARELFRALEKSRAPRRTDLKQVQ